MCHPWLAAGVICFIVVQSLREIGPVLVRREVGTEEPVSGLLGARVRGWFRGRVDPLVDAFLAAGVTANLVTGLQLVASVLCGVAYGVGWIFTAGWVLITSGTLDVVDGAIARKGGVAGRRGAFLDSVVDRYGEGAVFAGLIVHFREGWSLWVVLAAFFGSLMVSYTRARAEGLGMECTVGLMQRAERYVVLGGGSMASSLAVHLTCAVAPSHDILLASVAVVAVLANATALQRAVFAARRLL